MKICKTCKKEKHSLNFDKHPNAKDGLRNICKACTAIRSLKNRNAFLPYVREIWRGVKKTVKKRPHIEVNITEREFYQLLEDQMDMFGLFCPITGKKFTHVVGLGQKMTEENENNISIDRIDNLKGYTPDNIVFVTKKLNVDKRALTIDQMIAIINLYKFKHPKRFKEKINKYYKKLDEFNERYAMIQQAKKEMDDEV